MAYHAKEHTARISEKQQEWQSLALAYMKEKGPNEDGSVGYMIRPIRDRDIGNNWIDWLWANGFKEAARAVAPMTRNLGGYMVPCRSPNDFELWMQNQGKKVVSVPFKRYPPAAVIRSFTSETQKRFLERVAELDPDFDYDLLTRRPDFTQEAIDNAIEKCKSFIGNKAHSEGWLMGLFEFIRDYHTYPNDAQMRSLKMLAKINDETMADPSPAVQKMAEARKERFTEIESRIFAA